jgi:hypothetical protein
VKSILASVVITACLLSPAFAGNDKGNNGNGNGGNHDGTLGAPVPLLGAGPGFAVGLGYGVFLLVRRRRNVG